MNRQLLAFGALAFSALAAACDSPTVPERQFQDVYDFRIKSVNKTLHWPLGSNVRVYVVGGSTNDPNGWLSSAVDHAASVWNAAALYGEFHLQQVKSVNEADAVVQFSLVQSPIDVSACLPSGPDAVTTFCLSAQQSDRLYVFPLKDGGTSNVKFVVSIRQTAAVDQETTWRLVTHEIGHVLGIAAHSPLATDLMFGGSPLLRSDPNSRDRATLEVLYHTKADITP